MTINDDNIILKQLCCVPSSNKESLQDYETLDGHTLINTKDQSEEDYQTKFQSHNQILQPSISLAEQQQTKEQNFSQTEQNIISNTPVVVDSDKRNQFELEFELYHEQYFHKETLYEIGFISKPNQTQRAYIIKHIKHNTPSKSILLYKIALYTVYSKLDKYKKRVFFYFMCVPGVNSCSRGRQFVKTLRSIPLYFVYLTLQANLKSLLKQSSQILPIVGGPSTIRSLQETKDWIILDYGQHGTQDNLIREDSPSYNKIVPTMAETLSRCRNVVIIYPWGMTKQQIFDLHNCVYQELDNNLFNFDIQLHSFQRQSDDFQILIGFYGDGIKMKSQQLSEAYPQSIINLFDTLPQQKQRLYAIFQYLIQIYGHQDLLNLICQLRQIDSNPHNLIQGLYSRLKQIAIDKGVRLVFQGQGFYVSLFDSDSDISMCKKKVIQRKLSNQYSNDNGKGEDDYSYRQNFWKNRPRFFSNEFQTSESSSQYQDLNKSQDSVFG